MKRYVFMSILLLSILAVPAVFSQEFEPEDMEMQLEMHERKMELEQRQAKMDMERKMQELDLEQRRMELERARDDGDDGKGALGVLMLICGVVHILVAVWVYMDIRQLNRGSGIWIVIALLTGLMGALVYAIVRLGNGRQKGA
jgi:hypothetical protein